jgi:hypothetical protein
LQISQGYIIRILQHFATKLRNITNFVMLFQAVMKLLSIDQNLVYNANGPFEVYNKNSRVYVFPNSTRNRTFTD